MYRLVPVILALVILSACSSSGSPSEIRYYQFHLNDTDATSVKQTDDTNKVLLRLSPIKVQGTLNNRAMVIKLSEHEIYSANSHFWADSPAQMLASHSQTQLLRELDNVLVVKGADVYAEQLQSTFYQLDITVERFNAGIANDAEVSGMWRLSSIDSKGKLHVKRIARFAHSEPLVDDGYEHLAKALEVAWRQVITDISIQIDTHLERAK